MWHLDAHYENTRLPPGTVKVGFRLRLFLAGLLCTKCCMPFVSLRKAHYLPWFMQPKMFWSMSLGMLLNWLILALNKSFGHPLRALTHKLVDAFLKTRKNLLDWPQNVVNRHSMAPLSRSCARQGYCCGVHVWFMSCAFAEMAIYDPPFCDDSEVEQLFRIFRIRDGMAEETWSSVAKLPHYNPTLFPSWHANRLCSQEMVIRNLDADGLDLLTVCEQRYPYFFYLSLVVTTTLPSLSPTNAS